MRASSAFLVGSAALGWFAIAVGPPGGGPTAASAAAPGSKSAASSITAPQGIDLDAVQAPSRRRGAWVARVTLPTDVERWPGGGGRIWRAKPTTAFNSEPQRLLVLSASRTPDGREWLEVRLPIRPNKAAGWIPREHAVLVHTRYSITVNVRRRRVSVYRTRGEGRRPALVRHARAVVGKRGTPTPKGLFAIYETVRQPDPKAFLGNWALHLTAHSNVLFNFGGGDGRVAIHGRGGRSLATPLGTAASNGCIRMNNRFIGWLRKKARTGTPVRITGG